MLDPQSETLIRGPTITDEIQIPGQNLIPPITYNPDGEGRLYSTSVTSGQNPLTSVSYNVFGLPTTVQLGSGDGDSYTYDPNTRATLSVLSWAAKRSGGVRAVGIGGAGAYAPPSLAGGGGSVQALWMADYLGQQGLYWSVSGGPTVGEKGAGAVGGVQYMTSTSNTNVTVRDVVNSSLSVGGGAGAGFGLGVDVNLQTGVFTETIGFGTGGFGGSPAGLNIASGFIPICHE